MSDDPPTSEFLRECIKGRISLTGSALGEVNLRRLIGLTADPDTFNREWAVLLLDRAQIDTPGTHAAFLHAADDEDYGTRDQALVALARRDACVALDRLTTLLKDECSARLFQAATILADARLLPLLRNIEGWRNDEIEVVEGDQIAELEWLRKAIVACEAGDGTPTSTT